MRNLLTCLAVVALMFCVGCGGDKADDACGSGCGCTDGCTEGCTDGCTPSGTTADPAPDADACGCGCGCTDSGGDDKAADISYKCGSCGATKTAASGAAAPS